MYHLDSPTEGRRSSRFGARLRVVALHGCAMTYAYDTTLTCDQCGFTLTAKNPRGPMGHHKKRCAATIEDVARLVGADYSNPDACWVPSSTKEGGRAKVAGPRGTVRAHVRAFELHFGRSPRPGFIIMHKCDTGNCINPRHFREGTQQDNIRDMHMKGRSRGAV